MSKASFRISSYLKDIIGRDLVTNEFVAIFELVKNSFDAGATRVDIEFDPHEGTLTIIDDGSGMDEKAIRRSWLFVAYSEKATIETIDYRDRIKPAGQFAGNKGIGRFACDTLGEALELYSKRKASDDVVRLEIDWTDFEQSSLAEFQKIEVDLSTCRAFPPAAIAPTPSDHGTVLIIKRTRHRWDEETIARLRKDLAKLIDPFGTTDEVEVSTWLVDGRDGIEGVDGPVGNEIADLLQDKTSRIYVTFDKQTVETKLFDRGRLIYHISEPLPYEELLDCKIEAQVFFLNRSAKHTFTSRMGVRPVEFGSVFLFLNGFRIFPIGEEFDDTFGLSRRKQQGSSRYLGTRDILGRVDVSAAPKMFREVSSRDAGLIEDARSRALYDAIRRYVIFRLERYVVGVNWKDKIDQNKEDSSGLENDPARARILDVIGSLGKNKSVSIIYFDEDIVRVTESPEKLADTTLKSLAVLAEKQGSEELLNKIENARQQFERLNTQREEAIKEAERAINERSAADARIARLEQQTKFLGSSQDVDVERLQLLMHQAIIHSGHMRSAISNASSEAHQLLKLAASEAQNGSDDDIKELLASVRQHGKRISNSLASARLSSDRLKTVLSFSQNIRIDLDTDIVTGDIVQFFREYIDFRITDVPDLPKVYFEDTKLSLKLDFSPVDIAVLLDNLIDNSMKHKASRLTINARKSGSHSIVFRVSDDGLGIDRRKVDRSKIFERGYTGSRNGTGLGLYSVKQIVEKLGGKIELTDDESRAEFDITLLGKLN